MTKDHLFIIIDPDDRMHVWEFAKTLNLAALLIPQTK